MEEKKERKFQGNIMMQISSIIVNKWKAFLVFFGLAFVFSVACISKVLVNNELTDYLPETTETRQGLDIMNEEFTTFGSAKIMVTNIAYDKALEIAGKMEQVPGVSEVKFYDAEDEDYEDKEIRDYYVDFAALYTISFEDEETTEEVQAAIATLREMVSGYDYCVYTTIDKDDAASLREDMKVIIVLIVLIIVSVLIFTSQTYMEIVVFMLTFGMALVLNMGTNFWFGEISYVSNSVSAVLQIALAIDYAIILFHRFMEERADEEPRKALIIALSKAIPEISSSSLTTMAGMVALMTMQFGIGPDLGKVLLKSIIFSMISVFAFMPALIMIFEKGIQNTMHKSFVPKISWWGRSVLKLRHVFVPVFLLLVVIGIYFSNRCPYIYDQNSIESEKKSEFMAARDDMEEYFKLTNTMAVVIPKGDYGKEAKLLNEIAACRDVENTLGLANVEVGDDGEYVLTDSLTPRAFAEVADMDVDTIKMLYSFYAWKNEKYGAFMEGIDGYEVSIIDIIDFLYEQQESGGLKLSADQTEDIEDIHKSISDARRQLEGEEYSRLIFTWRKPLESEDTFSEIDEIRDIALKYYDKVWVVGDSTSDYDLSKTFVTDNTRISILTALLVGVILLFTFQSAGLPFLLVLTIQGSIWINFSIPYLKSEPMFFLSYLIVSSIQMGATIDYAIVITSRYLDLRDSFEDRKEAIVETLNQAFPTIVTSGSIMAAAGFVIGKVTSNPTISSLGQTLCVGVLISILLVMTVLPAMLFIFNWFIDKTALSRVNEFREGIVARAEERQAKLQTEQEQAEDKKTESIEEEEEAEYEK